MTRARLPILGSTIARRWRLGIGGTLICLLVRGRAPGRRRRPVQDEDAHAPPEPRALQERERSPRDLFDVGRGDAGSGQPVLQAAGTNGRACATCHAPEDAFSLSLPSIQERFEESCGNDPLFVHDGTDNPNLDRSTLEARRIGVQPAPEFRSHSNGAPAAGTARFRSRGRRRPDGKRERRGCGTPECCSRGHDRRVPPPAHGVEPPVPERHHHVRRARAEPLVASDQRDAHPRPERRTAVGRGRGRDRRLRDEALHDAGRRPGGKNHEGGSDRRSRHPLDAFRSSTT